MKNKSKIKPQTCEEFAESIGISPQTLIDVYKANLNKIMDDFNNYESWSDIITRYMNIPLNKRPLFEKWLVKNYPTPPTRQKIEIIA